MACLSTAVLLLLLSVTVVPRIQGEDVLNHKLLGNQLYYAHNDYQNRHGAILYCDLIGGETPHDFKFDDDVHKLALSLFRHTIGHYFWMDTIEDRGEIRWRATGNKIDEGLWNWASKPALGQERGVVMTNLDLDGRLVGVENLYKAYYPFCVIDVSRADARAQLKQNINHVRCDDRIPILDIIRQHEPDAVSAVTAADSEDVKILAKDVHSLKQSVADMSDSLKQLLTLYKKVHHGQLYG